MTKLQSLLKTIGRLLIKPFSYILSPVVKLKIFDPVRASLSSKEIQRRIIFTVFIIIIFRILAAIPLPGIDIDVYKETLNTDTGSFFSNLWTLATGGNIDSPSLVVIGLGSYINASIIIQLLSAVVPKLEELQKEGPSGRKVINQLTRILTLPLSLLQGFVIYTVIKNNSTVINNDLGYVVSDLVSGLTTYDVAILIVAIAAGSIVLMWLSELITENGIGNGSSIIIMVGILASLPGMLIGDFGSKFSVLWDEISNGNFNYLFNSSMIFIYFFIIGMVLLVGIIVFVNEAERKVVIQYARRVRGMEASQASYLPFKINQAGVMPIIFASSILTFPTIIAQFIQGTADPSSSYYKWATELTGWKIFNFVSLEYITLYFLLIIFFTYFYTFIINKPEQTAENLQKSGAFIPGIRPGSSTNTYLTHLLMRLTFVGAIFLAGIAIFPNLVRLSPDGANLLTLITIGGTSLLIIVGVVIDTNRQIKSLTVTRSYEIYK